MLNGEGRTTFKAHSHRLTGGHPRGDKGHSITRLQLSLLRRVLARIYHSIVASSKRPGQHDQTRSMRPRVQGDGPLFKLPVQGRLPYSKCSIVLAITCAQPARSRRGRRPRLLQKSFALANASLLSTDDWKHALSGLLRYVRNRHLRSVFHRLQRQAS
jgi:hypothetical protein